MYIIAQTINGGKTSHSAISREFAGKILRLVNLFRFYSRFSQCDLQSDLLENPVGTDLTENSG